MIFLLYLGVFPDTGLVLALRITTMLIRVNITQNVVNRHQKFFRQTTIGIIHSAMSVVNWNEKIFFFDFMNYTQNFHFTIEDLIIFILYSRGHPLIPSSLVGVGGRV